MTDQDICPACQSQICYAISTDSHICVGCGKTYAWPIYPPDEPAIEPPQLAEPDSDPQ